VVNANVPRDYVLWFKSRTPTSPAWYDHTLGQKNAWIEEQRRRPKGRITMSRNVGSMITMIALTLLVVACGGDKKTAATAAPPSPNTASSPAAATTAATVAAGGNAVVSNAFCGDWGAVAAQSAKLTAPTGQAASMKDSFDATNAYLKALADKAPADIKGDFQVYAKFWSDYATVMAKANYDMTKAATDPDLQKAMQAMSDPKLQQASINIGTWVQKNCVAGR
jgi:hypothetical protein